MGSGGPEYAWLMSGIKDEKFCEVENPDAEMAAVLVEFDDITTIMLIVTQSRLIFNDGASNSHIEHAFRLLKSGEEVISRHLKHAEYYEFLDWAGKGRFDLKPYEGTIGLATPKKVKAKTTKKIMLVSGGLDSSYMFLTENVDRYIYIDFGNMDSKYEQKVLKKLGIPYELIKIDKLPIKNGIVQARNFKFMLAIRDKNPNCNLEVYIGNNLDDEVDNALIPDNLQYTLKRAEEAIDLMYYGVSFKIISPLVQMTKVEIAEKYVELCKEKYGNIILPHWCEVGPKHCGKCLSCKSVNKQILEILDA